MIAAVWQAASLMAVYLGAVAIVLAFVNRVSALRAVEVLALVLLPMTLTGRALLTGRFYGPLNLAYESDPLAARAGTLPKLGFSDGILSDVAIQMVPWRKAVRDAVKTGHLPLLNRFTLCGDPLLGSMQPQALHPNTWLGFLLPLATAWTFASAFTFFLAAAGMWLLLRDIGVRLDACLLGAGLWMLSECMTFLVGWPHASVFAMLGWVAAGLRRIARSEPAGFRLTVFSLTLMVLGGHPESMLHVTAAAGVLFLFDLSRSPAIGRSIIVAIAAGLLALALTAVALLPFLEALGATAEKPFRENVYAHEAKSVPLPRALAAAKAAVLPESYGVPWSQKESPPGSFNSTTAAFIGGVGLAFVAVGALCSRRRERIALTLVAILSLAVAVGLPGVASVVGRLPLFNVTINERFAGVTAFAAAALAAFGFEAFWAAERRARITFGLATVALVGGGAAQVAANRHYHVDAPGLAPFLLWTAIPATVFLLLFSRRSSAMIGSVAVFLLGVRLGEKPSLYPTFETRHFYPPVPELAALPQSGSPYRIAGWRFSMVPNQSSLWEVEDPRGYNAMNNLRLRETFDFWCVPQFSWFNRIENPSTPFLRLLNVRFLLAGPTATAPPGWHEVIRGPNCTIFEDRQALPRALAPRRVRRSTDAARRLDEMSKCPNFADAAWIETPELSDNDIENGPATVAVTEDGPHLNLDVHAARPTWIVVSETNWPGWRAFDENRRELPLAFADHAFLGIYVPAGTHRVNLQYLPRSFVRGAWISSLAVVSIAMATLWRRARGRAVRFSWRGARARP